MRISDWKSEGPRWHSQLLRFFIQIISLNKLFLFLLLMSFYNMILCRCLHPHLERAIVNLNPCQERFVHHHFWNNWVLFAFCLFVFFCFFWGGGGNNSKELHWATLSGSIPLEYQSHWLSRTLDSSLIIRHCSSLENHQETQHLSRLLFLQKTSR